jgi:hypothetical protein
MAVNREVIGDALHNLFFDAVGLEFDQLVAVDDSRGIVPSFRFHIKVASDAVVGHINI